MTELTADGLTLSLPDGRTVRVRLRNLDDYEQNPANPVLHPQRNRDVLVDSVKRLRALRSGVAKEGRLAAGNLTQQAMREAGINQVVEVQTDGEAWVMVDRSDLTEEDFRLAAYYDQQSGMLATWDADQVAADIDASGGERLLALMFSQPEIQAILAPPGPELDFLGLPAGETPTRQNNNMSQTRQSTATHGLQWGEIRVVMPATLYERAMAHCVQAESMLAGISRVIEAGLDVVEN